MTPVLAATGMVVAVLAGWLVASVIAGVGWIVACELMRRFAPEDGGPHLICAACGTRTTVAGIEAHLLAAHPDNSLNGEYRCGDCHQLVSAGCWPQHIALAHGARPTGAEDAKEWTS